MSSILLTTLNARYGHASLGLRYLMANMGPLADKTRLLEFTIADRPELLAEKILADDPVIVGIGVYIWNIEPVTRLVALLRMVCPELCIVLGGPEVSYEWDQQEVFQWCSYVITGAADHAFRDLCLAVLAGQAPVEKVIHAGQPALEDIHLPYAYYTDEDIAHRTLYVEASRGCPFRCEFCLSALDKTAVAFQLDRFLEALEDLWSRGARQFKFVDRTFNLNIKASQRILAFFLDRMTPGVFVHFEVIPDHLPESLKAMLARFPEGALQLEIGVQSFNPEVQSLIQRRQDNEKTVENLRWLRQASTAHLHVDLIAGLPGEDLASFAIGFNRLVALDPHEIQLGILKRLRGAPIARHDTTRRMRYQPYPPYTVLATDDMDFYTLQRLLRFARYWDLVANSGRFHETRRLLLGDAPFERFMMFSDWLYASIGRTHEISLDRLYDVLHDALVNVLGVDADAAIAALTEDHRKSGVRRIPRCLEGPRRVVRANVDETARQASMPRRQSRHLAGG